MAERSWNWNAIRDDLWAAAAGITVGGAIIALMDRQGVWIAAAAVVIIAAIALFAGSRVRGRALEPLGAGGQSPSLLSQLAREVFERLPDPLMLLDASGRALFANDAMRAIIGTDVERKHVSMLLRTPSVLAAVTRTAETGEPASADFTFRVPVERHYQAYVLRTQSEPRLTALLLHDMTAIRRAEQARADFVANASHELRTPLAAVAGFIETLRGHAKDDAEAREKFLSIMSVEAGRMRRLIDDLLSLNRIELNEHVPPSGRVDLAGVVRDAAAALTPLAQADRITVAVDAPPELPPVIGARDELIQLFQNLLHNAIKYGKPSGHVWVKLGTSPARRGLFVCASVKDDGEGIPRDAIFRLTERFYRVDVKRSREKGGTGLGLAIVKHIVSRHQGRLQIESEAGEGSTFTVILPAADAAVQTADAAVTEVL